MGDLVFAVAGVQHSDALVALKGERRDVAQGRMVVAEGTQCGHHLPVLGARFVGASA